jgi:predicted metalloprotease with PDZ domain
MKRLVFCWVCVLFARFASAETSRPDVSVVEAEVARLGADSFEEREQAQRQLTEWAEDLPRYMLTLLVEQYRHAEDVEVVVRLREVLRPLAMTYLFNGARGFIGVNMDEHQLENGEPAILLQAVHQGRPAFQAGLRTGDVIVSVEGQSIPELGGLGGFASAIAHSAPGSLIEVGVRRGRDAFTVRLQPMMWPADVPRSDNTTEKREQRFQSWLQELRPRSIENGIPVGHFPAEREKEETP